MKGYLLKILGVFIMLAVAEVMLPGGNMKKYAKVLLSILVCHALLTPIGVLPEFDIEEEKEIAKIDDTFESEVLAEYKKRIEENIFENCAAEAEVILDTDGNIEKVILWSDAAKSYVTEQLGVLESDIEIRKN